jgi:hypothetical protein
MVLPDLSSAVFKPGKPILKPTKSEVNKTIQERVALFKLGKITLDELMGKGETKTEQVTEDPNNPGIYKYKGDIVFCNCLLGKPCKYCNDDIGDQTENINILIDLTISTELDAYVAIVYFEIGRDTRKKSN